MEIIRFSTLTATAPPSQRSRATAVFTDPEARPSPGRQHWGVGASPGLAVGRVRVVTTLEDAALVEPGEVAVCPAPSLDLVTGLDRPAAVIAERGGPLGAGATLLRERGIPAVVGLEDACRRLRTGQSVVVDGDRGAVWIDAVVTEARESVK